MPEGVMFSYKCNLCGKVFKNKNEAKAKLLARECEKNHDIVMVPMLRSDIQRLLSFLVTKNEDLLTRTLWDTLRQYRSLV